VNLAYDHQDVVPVVRRPEYTLSLEQANVDTTFLHCTIHVPWTGRVRKQFSADFKALMDLHGGPLHAIVDPENEKLMRFIRLFGGEHVAYFTDLSTDGRTKLIYRN
jgi:hypothetical protein